MIVIKTKSDLDHSACSYACGLSGLEINMMLSVKDGKPLICLR